MMYMLANTVFGILGFVFLGTIFLVFCIGAFCLLKIIWTLFIDLFK